MSDMTANVLELERRLGISLPADYRDFLFTHRERALVHTRNFLPPRSGSIDVLLTADEMLENDEKKCFGIPEKSLMYIGRNIFGGCLYMKVSDDGFGQIHYLENYHFTESFPSFSAYLNES